MKINRLKYIFTLFFVILGGASLKTTMAAEKKLKIVTSFSILGDLTRQIGGEDVDVDIIVPENSDPHIYEPKPLDVKKLSQADLVIVNGLGFEGWFNRLIINSGYKGDVIVAAKKVLPRILHMSQGVNAEDPHAWHNVKNAILYVTEIKQALQKKLPEKIEKIETSAQAYIGVLQELDQWVHSQFNKIDPQLRKVITTHDAFAYFGAEYGIEFLSPVGISTDAQPTAAKVADLITIIKEQNIRAIFIENLADGRLITEIANEANIEVDGTLYADSLSSRSDLKSPASTYVEMIRYNTLSLHKKLTS